VDELVKLQNTVSTCPDQIASNQVRLDWASLTRPDEIQAKRKEIESRREELFNRRDVATARAVRLRTLLRASNQAMAAALEPFFNKNDGNASRAAVEWLHDGTGKVRCENGGDIDIGLSDSAPARVSAMNGQNAPAQMPLGDSSDKIDGKYRWHIDQENHVTVECGCFVLGFSIPAAANKGCQRIKQMISCRVDLDGLAAIAPERP
jgi:hypothetical protein